jgi:hypothetical protein
MSFQDSFCNRQFLDLAGLPPAVPSLLSCPLLTPFVALACGECGVSVGEIPLVGGTVSREYWLRPSRPRAFCGGRPPLREVGGGLGSEVGTSGGAISETTGGMMGSSLGVGVGVGSRASFSVRCQLVLEAVWAASIPSPFLRSARPFRLFAASLRSLSRSFSRCSFWCWLRAAAPRGFCFGAEALVLSSSDSTTGEALGERELVRCRLTSDLIL